MAEFRIGTRRSKMAIAQAELVQSKLAKCFPEDEFTIVSRDASGDRDVVSRLGSHGGKGGAFINDIRATLTNGECHMVMHSLKDLPGDQEYYTDSAFEIGAYLERDDPWDCLVVADGLSIDNVIPNGVVGTNSVRRKAFLRHLFPNLTVVHSRGAVLGRENAEGHFMPGRIENLDAGRAQGLPYDGAKEKYPAGGLVLAVSGLKRLGVAGRATHTFSINEMVPAIGQGVVIVECAADDVKIRKMLARISDAATKQCCDAERTMLRYLNGNCHSPIAGHSWIADGRLHLRGVVLHPDGGYFNMVERSTAITEPAVLGQMVAADLNARGAQEVIAMSTFYDDS